MQLRFAEPERMLSDYLSRLCIIIHCELFSLGHCVWLWRLDLGWCLESFSGVLSLSNLGAFCH